jgi:chaperone required for assembly of F1-ATPase
MAEWKSKRFWKEASVEAREGGFAVLLDGRQLKTPAKATLLVPGRDMAEEIAAEWQAQEEQIDPLSMPFTRSANAAIDKVAAQHDEVVEIVAAYGGTDLLCYRADGPEELVARQNAAWDPLLEQAVELLDVRLKTGVGITFVEQDKTALARLEKQVREMDNFRLTALYDLVAMSGSLVIGLAATRNPLDIGELWRASRVDEDWQQEQWGEDDEAKAAILVKKEAFFHAARFYFLSI